MAKAVYVSELNIYPVKSLAGLSCESVALDVLGPENDRRFMVVDDNYQFVTQRECAEMALIKASLSPQTLSLACQNQRFELALDPQTDPVTGNPAPQFRTVSGGANEWVEIEFTFTGLPATPTTYNMLVIKPDNPDGSDGELTTEERTFYFDDLRLE